MIFSPASPGKALRAKSRRRRCIVILQAAKMTHGAVLPGSFSNARNLALISQLTEADTANAVVAQVCVGAAADFAAIIFSGGELRRSLLLDFH